MLGSTFDLIQSPLQFADRLSFQAGSQLIENVSGTLDVAISGLGDLARETTVRVPTQASKEQADAIADRMLDQCKLADVRQRLARQFGRYADPHSPPPASDARPADADDNGNQLS